MKMKCMIVDDEPAAREVIKHYLADVPWLELVYEASNAIAAAEQLKSKQIDVIFLDINMPKLDGISFLKMMKPDQAVILTTAYAEHALEGYALQVLDYLLKPFSFERFLQAVNRFPRASYPSTLVFKSDKKRYLIQPDEIVYVESMGDYIKLHCTDRMLIVHETMKELEEKLQHHAFVRIHRSYIINVKKVDYLEGNMLSLAGQRFPIGETYRNDITQRFAD